MLEQIADPLTGVGYGVQALAVGAVIYVVKMFLTRQSTDQDRLERLANSCHDAHVLEREAYQSQLKIILGLQRQQTEATNQLTHEILELSKAVTSLHGAIEDAQTQDRDHQGS